MMFLTVIKKRKKLINNIGRTYRSKLNINGGNGYQQIRKSYLIGFEEIGEQKYLVHISYYSTNVGYYGDY